MMTQNLLCASFFKGIFKTMMPLSKFEACLHVLKAVKKRNLTTYDQLLASTMLGEKELEYSIVLLVENSLIEERANLYNKIIYRVTDRGEKVLSFFGLNNLYSVPQ